VRYRFAVAEGRTGLLGRLNDGLLRVHATGRYDEIYDRWLGVLRDEGLMSPEQERWVKGVGGVLGVFLLIAFLWSRTLQSQVESRTRDLAAEQERSDALQQQLFQSQKMEALGRLAAGVAHDFNNLLAVVLGNTALARDRAASDIPVEARLERIHSAGESGVRLIEQLLTFSRRQTIEPRDLSWNEVVRDSREMLERPLTRSITVHTHLAEDLLAVRLDPSQALQVLMNLLLNARDAIPSTGNVWIETANVREPDGDFVRLSVRDDGVGMEKETCEHVFEPFYTTKAEGEGTGLGLATVYGIVEQSGGRINVESQPGEGTRFDILLPRAPEKSDGG
jgi:signal transduction histidine kinase